MFLFKGLAFKAFLYCQWIRDPDSGPERSEASKREVPKNSRVSPSPR